MVTDIETVEKIRNIINKYYLMYNIKISAMAFSKKTAESLKKELKSELDSVEIKITEVKQPDNYIYLIEIT